jgi:hypothetical protein
VVRTPRARARGIKAGGLTCRPGAWIGRQHSLSDRAIRKRAKANGVDPGPLGRRAEPGLGKVCDEGVRANLIAGVAPSGAAIVDAAAACGSGTCISAWSSTISSRPSPRRIDEEFPALERIQLDPVSGVDFARTWVDGSDALFAELLEARDLGQRSRPMYERQVKEPRLTSLTLRDCTLGFRRTIWPSGITWS